MLAFRDCLSCWRLTFLSYIDRPRLYDGSRRRSVIWTTARKPTDASTTTNANNHRNLVNQVIAAEEKAAIQKQTATPLIVRYALTTLDSSLRHFVLSALPESMKWREGASLRYNRIVPNLVYITVA